MQLCPQSHHLKKMIISLIYYCLCLPSSLILFLIDFYLLFDSFIDEKNSSWSYTSSIPPSHSPRHLQHTTSLFVFSNPPSLIITACWNFDLFCWLYSHRCYSESMLWLCCVPKPAFHGTPIYPLFLKSSHPSSMFPGRQLGKGAEHKTVISSLASCKSLH